MIKIFSLVFLLLFNATTLLFGQRDNTLSEIDIHGRFGSITVSPNECIWIGTGNGHLFYCEDIRRTWKEHKLTSDSLKPKRSFNKILFFNRDKAILIGDNYDKIYQTKNAGKTWSEISYGEQDDLYTGFVNKEGNGWIGGRYGGIFYTPDYGKHWRKLNSPFNDFTGISTICMLDAKTGIAGSKYNNLYSTSDNWKTFSKMETPEDHKRTRDSGMHLAIDKVFYWRDYIVCKVSKEIFFTDRNKIDWQKFPVTLRDVISDDSGGLLGLTKDLKFIRLKSPNDHTYLNYARLSAEPVDYKIVNNSIYYITENDEIFKLSGGISFGTLLLTNKTIAKPKIIIQTGSVYWGFNPYKRHLYRSADSVNWTRIFTFPFGVDDIKAINDKEIVVRHRYNNFVYKLNDTSYSEYHYTKPLAGFLKSPTTKIKIETNAEGCEYWETCTVEYESSGGDELRLIKAAYFDSLINFNNRLSKQTVDSILGEINFNPNKIPSMNDIGITEIDKKEYLLLKEFFQKYHDDGTPRYTNKQWYYDFVNRVDTMGPKLIKPILEHEFYQSTSSSSYKITFYNIENDSVQFFTDRSDSRTSFFHLPFICTYQDKVFPCYDLTLGKLSMEIIPEKCDFMRIPEDKAHFLLAIADYLYRQEEY